MMRANRVCSYQTLSTVRMYVDGMSITGTYTAVSPDIRKGNSDKKYFLNWIYWMLSSMSLGGILQLRRFHVERGGENPFRLSRVRFHENKIKPRYLDYYYGMEEDDSFI